MQDGTQVFVDARRAAEFCGLSRVTIWKLARDGRIPHVRPTGRQCVRFHLRDLEEWMRREAGTEARR